jgi:hypothetical protein
VKPATKAILLVVGVAVLYAAALTHGLLRDDSGDSKSDPEDEPGMKMLRKVTMPFGPRYETRDLRCHGRLLSRGPQLSAEKADCTIEINPYFPEDEKYRVLVLDVEPEPRELGFTAYLRAVYKEDEVPADCFFADRMDAREFRLEVEYGEITDLKDSERVCWLKQELLPSLRVTLIREKRPPLMLPLPKLVLRCHGCNADPPRTITLRAEGET